MQISRSGDAPFQPKGLPMAGPERHRKGSGRVNRASAFNGTAIGVKRCIWPAGCAGKTVRARARLARGDAEVLPTRTYRAVHAIYEAKTLAVS